MSKKSTINIFLFFAILLSVYTWWRGPHIVKIENLSDSIVDVDVSLMDRASCHKLHYMDECVVRLASRPYRSSLDVYVTRENGVRILMPGCQYMGGLPEVTYVKIVDSDMKVTCVRSRMAFWGY